MTLDELLSTLETAYRLGVSQSTVYNRIGRAELPGAVQTPHGWRIPATTVDALIRDRDERAKTDEAIAAFAAELLAEACRRFGWTTPPPGALGRIAEAVRSVDAVGNAA